MLDLNTAIPAGIGWHLDFATGVNNAGQIAGYGSLGGTTHAFLLSPNSPPPPSNDNFANATAVSVSPGTQVGPINGWTRGAATEPGEPLHAGDAACFIIPGHVYTSTVWYKVTPSISGELIASTANPGTNFDTVLALYSGTALNNLSLIACDNNGDSETPPGSNPPWTSILHGRVQAGQSYYLQHRCLGNANGRPASIREPDGG